MKAQVTGHAVRPPYHVRGHGGRGGPAGARGHSGAGKYEPDPPRLANVLESIRSCSA